MAADRLISEAITPARGSFDAAAMARGEPGLPARFTWRQTEYAVADLLETWKSSEREGGSGEAYLRRHWFKVRAVPVPAAGATSAFVTAPTDPAGSTDKGGTRQTGVSSARPVVMTLYCLRQPPRGGSARAARRRWWVYSIEGN